MSVHIATPIMTWVVISFVILVVVSFSLFYLYKRRKKADIYAAVAPVIATVQEQKVVAEEKYKTNKIGADECKRLADKLEDVMRLERAYTNPDLKIGDLATMIGTSAHTMSYLFNQYLNRNYYDYINDFRIAEFKRLVDRDEYSKYTLSALAELCGFSSRASFFRYFKKATGITPNEYIRSIGKTNE